MDGGKMKVLVCGIDGYIGWPLALHLEGRGHDVLGLDNYTRRTRADSAIPLMSIQQRKSLLTTKEASLHKHRDTVFTVLKAYEPDCIVHLAEIPSAPYSMESPSACEETHLCNVLGTLNLLWGMRQFCPEAHLLKLGTLGEYGTPDVEIPEGHYTCRINGRSDRVMFPRMPGSFYHCTKVHDTHNIEFACRAWGLRATDVMQGVVYGVRTMEMATDHLLTRFDYDEQWGTAVNRFCAQALSGHPITLYGEGGQTRGWISLEDSVQCLTLALENPPESGEYRVFNQFEGIYSLEWLAKAVQLSAREVGLSPSIRHFENPRVEKERHFYLPISTKLPALGYRPSSSIGSKIAALFADLFPYKNRIDVSRIVPYTRWDGCHRPSSVLREGTYEKKPTLGAEGR